MAGYDVVGSQESIAKSAPLALEALRWDHILKRTRHHACDLEHLRVRTLERFDGFDPDAPPARPLRSRLGRDMFSLDRGDEPSDSLPLEGLGKEELYGLK